VHHQGAEPHQRGHAADRGHAEGDRRHLRPHHAARQQIRGALREGIAGLQDTFLRGALATCRDARTYAAKASNSFVDINHALDNFQIYINRQLNRLSEAWEQAVEAANLKIETMDHHWDVLY
jgi:hypothetical protein